MFHIYDNISVICSPVTVNLDPMGHHKPSVDFAVYLVHVRAAEG